MTRYTGVFRQETGGYGFIMYPSDADGNPPPNLPPEGGIFLSAFEARKAFGNQHGLMNNLHDQPLLFSIRGSDHHLWKVEAYEVDSASPRSNAI